MVGVINPNSTQTLDMQMKAAEKATIMVVPGDPVPKEGSTTSLLPGATNSPTSSPTPSDHHTLSRNATIGIAVGGVIFVAICAALFYFVGRAKSLKESMNRRDATVSKPSGQEYTGIPGSIPNSPGYSQYSPNLSQAEYGNHLSQNGWGSPTLHPTHISMMPQGRMSIMSGKSPHVAPPAEMASPSPTENRFAAELEAPDTPKSPPPR